MFSLSTIVSFLSRLQSGDHVDIAAAALVLLCVIVGFCRGISGELSRLLSLILGAATGYVLYIPGRQSLTTLKYLADSPQTAGLIALCVSGLGGVLIFLLAYVVLGRVIKILLDPFWNRLLGLLAGILNGAILLLLFFTLAQTLPDPAQRDLFCNASRTGRLITPLLNRAFETFRGAEKPPADKLPPAQKTAAPRTTAPKPDTRKPTASK